MNLSHFFQTGFQLLSGFIRYLYGFSQKGWVKGIFLVLSIFFCGFYIYKSGLNLTTFVRLDQLHLWFILISSLLIWFTVLSGALVWFFILKFLGVSIPFSTAIRIHLYSNIAKYIPGMIWQYVVKFVSLPEDQNLTPLIAIIIEFGLTIATGIVNILLFLPKGFSAGHWFPWLGLAFFAMSLLIPFIIKSRDRKKLSSVIPSYFVFAFLFLFINWNVLGISLWLADFAIQPLLIKNLPFYIFSITASIIGGILVLPVPQGIGVREGIMVFLLQMTTQAPNALFLAVISRLQIITGELLMSGLFWLVFRNRQ